jgi:hypothetical protein
MEGFRQLFRLLADRFRGIRGSFQTQTGQCVENAKDTSSIHKLDRLDTGLGLVSL